MPKITQEERDALCLTDEQWDALYYIGTLVQKQNEKWGVQDHSDQVWLAIDAEELGEAAEAVPLHTMEEDEELSIHRTDPVDFVNIRMTAVGHEARQAVENYFAKPGDKTRTNEASHPPDLDKEIGQTAAVACDWLASRWRRGL